MSRLGSEGDRGAGTQKPHSGRAYVSSTHCVTISATGWILTWRVTPSTATLKLWTVPAGATTIEPASTTNVSPSTVNSDNPSWTTNVLVRMPVRVRTLTATTADDEEGDVRAVFPADEERRCLVERDVFDADDRHETSPSRKG